MRGTVKRLSFSLLALFAAILLGAQPAHALGNGGTDSGSVTGTGTQDFPFYAEAGDLIKVGMTNVTQDAKFDGGFTIYEPDGVTSLAAASCGALTPGCRTGGTAPGGTTGMWKVRAKNVLGSSYPTFAGSFQIHLSVSGLPGDNASLYSGVSSSGTISNASMQMFTVNATSGDAFTITMTPGSGFSTNAAFDFFYPAGGSVYGGSGNPATKNYNSTYINTTGAYMLRTYDSTFFSGSGSYTVVSTGQTGLPTAAKQGGGHCVLCEWMAKLKAAGIQVAAQSAPVGSTGQTSDHTDPINIATGNMYERVSDYTTVGTNPLAFIRYYNSYSQQNSLYATALGPNWRSNYDRYLRSVSASLATAERADGQVINFTLSGGVGTPESDVDVKLTYSGSTYTLTDSDDTVETYTVAAGKGTLNSIAYPNGYTQTLTYTTGKLTSVSDSYSRTLTLSYTGSDLTGVSTPDSATLTYGYTSTAGSDLLTSVTYNTSPSTSQTYVYANTGLPFMLTSITDENGNTNSQWTYDGAGRCTMSEHSGGADEVQVSYDDSTGNRTATGPLGNADTYKFTTSKNMQKVNEIDRAANSPVASATRNFTYDANGYLATATDWNGNSTHWTNNSHGLPTSITEAYGAGVARTTTISYDSTWIHKPYTTTKTNVTIDDRYNASTGTLTSHTLKDTTGGSTNNQTHVWAYTYNGTGEMLTETFPRTGTTVKNTYTYSSGALASITDQLSHVTTINTANGTGQPTQITDQNSVVTNLTYDNRNRLLTKSIVASPSNELTTITRIGSGQINLITLPDSSTIDYDYDNAQRVTKITNTGSETINFTLNAAGKPTTTTIKDSGGSTKNSWTATYDVLGDMLTRVGSGGGSQTTTYAYDGMQNRTSTTDANSKVWAQAWDALLRPSTVTDPLTHTAAPTYNNLDQVTAQTDFLGYSTSYTRDGFGNAIARSSPDSGSWSYTLDEDNNVTGITDARSTATTNTFDAVDRLTAVSITGYSGEAEAFTYDATAGSNKGIGRLTSWSDESGTGSRVYDNFGNVTTDTRVINSKTYTTTYSYDLANRITEIIYPSGRYVDYTYDSSGYLTTITTKPSSGGGVTTLASSIVHKPFGPIASFTYGNSEALTKTFDNNYWLSTLNTVYSGTYVQELSFTEDNAGNLTAITDTLDSTRNESLGVDDLNRLHTASGKYGSRTYTYDNNSGRATRVAGATTYTYTKVASKNRLDHYTDGVNTRNFTWTANGNIATDDRAIVGGGSMSATYGGRDKLESMTVNSQGITYKLNAFNQRVSMAFSGATTHYVHDILGNIIAEADGSTGTTTKEYVWMEGELLAQIDGSGNIVYVHNNQVKMPQKITNPSRTVVWDQIIEPFGEVSSTPTSTTPTNIRFPGQYADANNALYHNNNRDYDPNIGYIQHDPLGFAGGYFPYAYAVDNPTQAIDPTGLESPGNLLKGEFTTGAGESLIEHFVLTPPQNHCVEAYEPLCIFETAICPPAGLYCQGNAIIRCLDQYPSTVTVPPSNLLNYPPPLPVYGPPYFPPINPHIPPINPVDGIPIPAPPQYGPPAPPQYGPPAPGAGGK